MANELTYKQALALQVGYPVNGAYRPCISSDPRRKKKWLLANTLNKVDPVPGSMP